MSCPLLLRVCAGVGRIRSLRCPNPQANLHASLFHSPTDIDVPFKKTRNTHLPNSHVLLPMASPHISHAGVRISMQRMRIRLDPAAAYRRHYVHQANASLHFVLTKRRRCPMLVEHALRLALNTVLSAPGTGGGLYVSAWGTDGNTCTSGRQPVPRVQSTPNPTCMYVSHCMNALWSSWTPFEPLSRRPWMQPG